ncbi:MAG: hypothetical protein HY033_07155 [Ignavibacteriae bacterium]|nr:hypothetical protein [Ignavibacteriota bacterium]
MPFFDFPFRHHLFNFINSIQFFDSVTGIAAAATAYERSSILNTTDGGRCWISLTDAFAARKLTITSTQFLNPFLGWVL